MINTMQGPDELWRMRKQFTVQLAAVNFMTYMLGIGSRLPGRFHLSRSTGNIAMSEIIPSKYPLWIKQQSILIIAAQATQAPVITPADVVPFRYTYNMQRFVGPVFMEGVMAPSMMAIARCLTEPEVSS